MAHFTEEELDEIGVAFGLTRVDTLPVRDGVVSKETMVWWRGEHTCERVKAERDWINIRNYPQAYSLEEPNYRIQYED
jgi:hypothetical protein